MKQTKVNNLTQLNDVITYFLWRNLCQNNEGQSDNSNRCNKNNKRQTQDWNELHSA